MPHLIHMAVGDTHTIQALNSPGQSITGLAWTSSDPTIVSLSTDDPPVLTAVAVGYVTISAGGASAGVTVSPVLAPGTTLWSNPGDGSGVLEIMPAAPSPTGVADVFAVQNDGSVQAITADGTTAWTATTTDYFAMAHPDFQGDIIATYNRRDNDAGYMVKFDGKTGQPSPAYTKGPDVSYGLWVVHPDGTVFMRQDGETDPLSNYVTGIDPTTGTEKFRVLLPRP